MRVSACSDDSRKMAAWQMPARLDGAKVQALLMNLRDKNPDDPPETALLAEDLCEVETYLAEKGGSEFVYDEELDVFRFKDGRFAFCKEFADWDLLRKRGYLDF